MEPPSNPSAALFDVYLRLRPSAPGDRERFLDVEEPSSEDNNIPTHITIKPPTHDTRKRAIERFAFTRVFQEKAGQRELFEHTGILPLVQGVLGATGREGRDGLLATLGVTGSGKSHTILGSKSQRGLTQLTLDVLFRHTAPYLANVATNSGVYPSLCSADASEAHLIPASHFRDSVFSDFSSSRATTPATPGFDSSFLSAPSSKREMPRFSAVPMNPSVDDVEIEVDTTAEYAIVVSMYEVYNDRIFDLLPASGSSKSPQKRRSLLFKSTEASPDRKVVAGLRKVICTNLEEALMVLGSGLQERRVAGTGSNAVSSRSHGFFCVEVKKRHRGSVPGPWTSSNLTIVDLAGSERARAAKTAGATLAEAGKINESLMYLGQCMQMQSDHANSATPAVVPFRQCKLTELLFSNSFSTGSTNSKAAQKAVMVVTADPLGDFNATSQILRYSALAREVTVPRIPSVTSTILAGVGPAGHRVPSGRSTPSSNHLHEDLEQALIEQARLREDLEMTQVMLGEEIERRRAAEASWRVAASRLDEVEASVREEVWGEMEARLAQEQRRWRAARDEELDRQDEHMDRKLAIMAQGITIHEDEDAEDDKENFDANADGFSKSKTSSVNKASDAQRAADLEQENRELRTRLEAFEREQAGSRSPSKKMRVLKTRKWEGSGMGLDAI